MKAVIIGRNGAEHQKGWGWSFACGLKGRGWTVKLADAPERCDLLVMWGVRRMSQLRHLAGSMFDRVCILERGYVGDRFKWTSVSFGGGLNGRGEFHGPFEDGSRWETHFAHLMKPWRQKKDGHALILQQVAGDASIKGVDMGRFYGDAARAFEHSMPVRMRPHPNVSPKRGIAYADAARVSLAHDLAGARLAVTWNSNSAVDAVLAGVPCVAMDKGSMAWDVTGHKLEKPPTPDRTAWAHAIAWKQWRREEMESGYCQEMVGL